MTFKNKQWYHKNNGEKGGRPKQDSNMHLELPEIYPVILTREQYDKLLFKYGEKVVKKAIIILGKWFESGSPTTFQYIGKNNYGHFRSDGWLIHEAKKW